MKGFAFRGAAPPAVCNLRECARECAFVASAPAKCQKMAEQDSLS